MERDEIIVEFLKGDEDKPMCIFLSYRELREDFTLIERQGEAAAPRPES